MFYYVCIKVFSPVFSLAADWLLVNIYKNMKHGRMSNTQYEIIFYNLYIKFQRSSVSLKNLLLSRELASLSSEQEKAQKKKCRLYFIVTSHQSALKHSEQKTFHQINTDQEMYSFYQQ